MRFLSVAERELRAAARRPGTYYVRWITGVAFFGLLVWLLWAFHGFSNPGAVAQVFKVFSFVIFFYCLVIGTARTADCLSSEKREGTLGLLYLTNLNSAEIVAGKLCSHALATVYGLIAIFPILALPLLMGGVTGDIFWRTVLALLNTILFSLAAGFVASAVCVRQFPAVAVATGLALVAGAGLVGVAAIVAAYGGAKWCVELLAVCCPLYPLLVADGWRIFGGHYWLSLVTVAGMSLTWLVLVAGHLSRTWRDRPTVIRSWTRFKFWQRRSAQSQAGQVAHRRRLLNINPFFWLAGRNRISSPVFILLVVIVILVTSYVTTPFFGRVMRAGVNAPMIGHLFSWVWATMAILGLSLYYAAMVASQRLAEDKQAGALEMILCTPTTERSISRGLWLAYGRRMLFPVIICVLVHCFFIWQVMIMASLEPPGRMLRGATPGDYFWAALLDQPIQGRPLEFGFSFMLHILLLLLVLLFVVWITLGWVGRWLGLRMKHPGFAPIAALTLVFVPPVLIFSFICYLADEFKIHRMPERQFLPMMMWVAFGIGVLHCVMLCFWAAGRLRRDFRSTVTSRFQPPTMRRWWRPSWRGIGRLALRTATVVVGLGLIVLSFYGYQNWRSRRAWNSFQAELKQKGESLDVTPLLPGPVPDEMNFARSPAFQKLLATRRNGLAKALLERAELNAVFERYVMQRDTFEWTAQQPLPLFKYAGWLGAEGKPGNRSTNNAVVAPILLQWWQQQEDTLRELARAARLPHFQVATNWDATAVIRAGGEEVTLLTRLHFLFVVRASACVETGQNDAASEDVLTSLHLARLARQVTDVRSSLRVNALLTRSCQPLWEGLAGHAWTEPQLIAFQEQLAQFNLMADHTNSIRRVVLAHLANWRVIAENPGLPQQVLNSSGGQTLNSAWGWQPRVWWFDQCIQLYQLGQRSFSLVDAANERIQWEYDWGLIRGLPLSDEAQQAIMPMPYVMNWPNPNALPCAQTALSQARLACALERHWLAHGKYPESLNELMPAYFERIPRDVITGRAMSYEKTADGRYILRGVGANQQDDRKSKTSDDWLWAYPTNAVPAVNAPGK